MHARYIKHDTSIVYPPSRYSIVSLFVNQNGTRGEPKQTKMEWHWKRKSNQTKPEKSHAGTNEFTNERCPHHSGERYRNHPSIKWGPYSAPQQHCCAWFWLGPAPACRQPRAHTKNVLLGSQPGRTSSPPATPTYIVVWTNAQKTTRRVYWFELLYTI